MDTGKIKNFFAMNHYEKAMSICRNTYSALHKKQFGSIGKKSYFMKPIYLSGMKNMYIGEHVGIWHNARVEVFDRWNDQCFQSKLIIGNHVNIGQNLHLTCAESIVIEDYVVCTARVTITDISHVTSDITLSVLEQNLVTNPVRICEGTFIGVNVTILPGVRIGKHCIIGSNAVITKSVPDYTTVAGVPAKIINCNLNELNINGKESK